MDAAAKYLLIDGSSADFLGSVNIHQKTLNFKVTDERYVGEYQTVIRDCDYNNNLLELSIDVEIK
jgi:hypothetical protein